MNAFGNFFAILQIVNQLFPLLKQMIDVVESAFPQGGNGAAKLEMVKQNLQNAYATISGASIAFEQVWSVLKPQIDSIVALTKTITAAKNQVVGMSSNSPNKTV